jgi:hypothetical protein
MIQNLNKIKINFQENKVTTFLGAILLLSLFWLKEINFLFYETLESPDIDKYVVYLENFFNSKVTNKEHGLMYYYLHSLNYSIFYSEFNNFELYIHKSIQQINFYIFSFGLVGYYKLLRLLGFSKNTIFVTLIFLNFFPPSISMRLVFKPEILAFALLPWIIFLFELFVIKKKVVHLYLAIPLIVSAITIKGNVLVIVALYLFFMYLKIILLIQKKHVLVLLSLFFISLTALTLENNKSNGKTILDIQSGSTIESNYDYKASPSVIYKTNMYQLITSPIKHNHADSFIGITLLETTGDYFDLYWDNDATEYLKNRKILLTYEQSNEIKGPAYNENESNIIIFQQRNTDVYLYESLGIIVSIILFFNLIRYTVKNLMYRKYLLAIFFGMAVLLFHSITGIPKNNFDPLVGDTFKPLYYSFVFLFSFAFLIALMLKEKFYRTLYIGLYCVLIVFILGFPKNDNFVGNIEISQKIQVSQFCFIEKFVYLQNSEFEDIQCRDELAISTENNEYEIYRNNLQHKPLNLVFILLNLLSVIYVSLNKRLIK